MQHVLGVILVVLLFVIGIPFLVDARTDARVRVINAEAAAEARIIRAEAEARSDKSKAFAIEMAALTPFTAVVMFGIAGLIGGVGVVIFAVKYRPSRPQVIERVIERHVVYLPAGTRREVWQALSSGKPAMILEGKAEERY